MAYADLTNFFVVRRVFGRHAEVLRGLLNDLLERTAERAIASIESFTDEELEAYRKARDEVQQMVQYGKDAELRGRNEGIAAGLAPLVRQFERRIGRALTATEHDALRGRLRSLGAERLGDVVLDLAPDALEHWLADAAAR